MERKSFFNTQFLYMKYANCTIQILSVFFTRITQIQL